jgi:hypothetical protein
MGISSSAKKRKKNPHKWFPSSSQNWEHQKGEITHTKKVTITKKQNATLTSQAERIKRSKKKSLRGDFRKGICEQIRNFHFRAELLGAVLFDCLVVEANKEKKSIQRETFVFFLIR